MVKYVSFHIASSFVKSNFIPKPETNTILSKCDAFYITWAYV
jgi:hypothetical protein